MTEYTMLTAIAPASHVDIYRGAAALYWQSGEGMFNTSVYNNEGTLVGYISSGLIDAEVASVLDDPEAFAERYETSVEQAQQLRDGFVYLAVGTAPVDEDGPTPLHGQAALNHLGYTTVDPNAEPEE